MIIIIDIRKKSVEYNLTVAKSMTELYKLLCVSTKGLLTIVLTLVRSIHFRAHSGKFTGSSINCLINDESVNIDMSTIY